MDSIELECGCCHYKQTFKNSKEAYDQGWDCAPYITQCTACPLCLGAYVILNKTDEHEEVHKRWAKEGRPQKFSPETCLSNATRKELLTADPGHIIQSLNELLQEHGKEPIPMEMELEILSLDLEAKKILGEE